MNKVIECLTERKSVRVFKDKPIPKKMREAILEAAFAAPTAGNQMLYTIIDVRDQALKEKLAVTCDNQPFIKSAPWVLIFLADCRRWLDSYTYAGLNPRLPGEGDFYIAFADAVIAAQNAVTAAESLGIGSCYIGDVVEQAETHKALFQLDDYVVPAAMLVFGYPTRQQRERKKPARFEKEYIVFKDRYRRLSEAEHRDMFVRQAEADGKQNFDYDAYMAAFCKRKYMAPFAYEMTRSAKAYLKKFNRRYNKKAVDGAKVPE